MLRSIALVTPLHGFSRRGVINLRSLPAINKRRAASVCMCERMWVQLVGRSVNMRTELRFVALARLLKRLRNACIARGKRVRLRHGYFHSNVFIFKNTVSARGGVCLSRQTKSCVYSVEWIANRKIKNGKASQRRLIKISRGFKRRIHYAIARERYQPPPCPMHTHMNTRYAACASIISAVLWSPRVSHPHTYTHATHLERTWSGGVTLGTVFRLCRLETVHAVLHVGPRLKLTGTFFLRPAHLRVAVWEL